MQEPKTPLKDDSVSYFFEEYTNHNLISKMYVHPEYIERYIEIYLDDHNDTEFEKDEYDQPIIPNLEEWDYNTEVCSLQDIIKLVPEGIDFNDVSIKIIRDRHINDIGVNIFYKTPNDKKAWQKLKDAQDKKYEEDLIIYNKEKLEYDLFIKEQQIEKLKSEIDKLKK